MPVDDHASATGKMGFRPAFILSMLTAVLLGVMAHFLVFRPLRNAAPLGKVIGSLGMMLYLQGVAQKNFGCDNPNPKAVFPDGIFTNFLGLGKPMPKDASVVRPSSPSSSAPSLWAFFQFTRFGLATRAAAGNEKGAVLLGYSPRAPRPHQLGRRRPCSPGSPACSSAPSPAPLNPVKFTGLIVPALGAALIGRLPSIPLGRRRRHPDGHDRLVEHDLARPIQSWWPKFITSSGAKDACRCS